MDAGGAEPLSTAGERITRPLDDPFSRPRESTSEECPRLLLRSSALLDHYPRLDHSSPSNV
ncbi:hypothetical protein PS718_00531 [Pseudomonas fluorescens]|uniref:Uncharacterized protein n=1 Tax=Pseudomonas fluorescens TaxID=294 RepID=A0A5E7A454_PSEFL|nr:hypothetical protein PS718_00531 [Pseudomonas fluorescens]